MDCCCHACPRKIALYTIHSELVALLLMQKKNLLSSIKQHWPHFPIRHLYWMGICSASLAFLFALTPSESVQANRSNSLKLNSAMDLESEWAASQQADHPELSTESTNENAEISDNPLPHSWHRIVAKIKTGDTLARVFSRYSIDSNLLHSLANHSNGQWFAHLHSGQELTLDFDSQDTLQGLSLQVTPLKYYIASRLPNNSFSIEKHETKPDLRVAMAHATITSSLSEAGRRADLPEKLMLELAKIFSWDIDFAQDLKQGDQFSVVYERHYVKGKPIGSGKILAAEFINDGHTFTAIRFEDADGQASYYTPSGQPMHKAFLRTPVEFTHISSYFDLYREHPILHTIRAHKGVDYAAPRGTPVKAAGDGDIVFAGSKNGYGKVIMIQHGPKYRTVYAHLNGYAKGIKSNMSIHQGQVIGYVGSTGLATGPHLHYEFQVNGIHQNPLTVKLPNSPTLSGKYLAMFQTKRQFLLHQLAAAKFTQTVVASSR